MKKYDHRHNETTFNDLIALQLLGERVGKYCFVETGTNLGAGVDLALQLGFGSVISIENDIDFFTPTSERFSDDHRVSILFGDSRMVLPAVCRMKPTPCLFWLDAHGYERTPLIEELVAIRRRRNLQDVIAIDDIRLIRNNQDWGTTVTIDSLIEAIGPPFRLTYFDSFNGESDILVFHN
jgi:hypothetical protein